MRLQTPTWLVAGLALLLSTGGAVGQGTFQNLNFEAANVPDVPAGEFGSDVSVSDGVPGWVVYIHGAQAGLMFHNNISTGGAVVAIYGPVWRPGLILDGQYTVSLQPATAGPPSTAAIGQTGQLPQTAQSLRFYGDSPNGAYVVTFAGQPISLVTLGSTSTYTIFAGDISAFKGQTGELRFLGAGELDNISFSNLPIPEPGVFSLSALGALLVGWRALRRQ